jgi:hypothetical protein
LNANASDSEGPADFISVSPENHRVGRGSKLDFRECEAQTLEYLRQHLARLDSRVLLSAATIGVLLLGAISCGSSSSSGDSGSAPSAAIPTEVNPPGDIPDDQAFVTYQSSAGGYSLDTPEGWAQTANGANVAFSDKLNSISVELFDAASAPTVDSATSDEIPQLEQKISAFEIVSLESVDLPAGNAIRIRYRANAAPDAVTGKEVRVEVDRYEFFKDGKEAAVSLSSPAGADNVDAWNQISRSFKWQ